MKGRTRAFDPNDLFITELQSVKDLQIYTLGFLGAPFFPGFLFGFSILALIYEEKQNFKITVNNSD